MSSLEDIVRRAGRGFKSEARQMIREADRARDARNWPVAARLYDAALAIAPERADIWVQYGHALKESGRRDEAEWAYHRALAIDSRQADTHLQLGHLLKLQQRYGEAGPAYLRALQLDPALYDALRELTQLAATGAYDPGEGIIEAIVDRAGLAADEP